jgi:hypothetical protein
MTINADDPPERPAAVRDGATMVNSLTVSPVQDEAGRIIGALTQCYYCKSLLAYEA